MQKKVCKVVICYVSGKNGKIMESGFKVHAF